jgi:hypothetical protein
MVLRLELTVQIHATEQIYLFSRHSLTRGDRIFWRILKSEEVHTQDGGIRIRPAVTIEFTGAIASTADRTACNGSLDSGRRDNSSRASQRASGAATDASQDGGHFEKHRNRLGACCHEGRRGPLASQQGTATHGCEEEAQM